MWSDYILWKILNHVNNLSFKLNPNRANALLSKIRKYVSLKY